MTACERYSPTSATASEDNARIVEQSFWHKLLKVAGQIPFAEDLAAAYFCAFDPETPGRVKGLLLAALAYFVLPFDAIPDFVAGFGFADDAAVLAGAIRMVLQHMKPQHYARARGALGLSRATDADATAVR
ncbi:MAG: DUF1232 domain-containing protein [Alphaproteobacteria bacterium]|nr:DUF1232 domain-containing protein [Alphaproteobacteria bacterium]